MRRYFLFLLTLLSLTFPARAAEVKAEVDDYLKYLKRFCIDGGLSIETAEREWKAAAPADEFNATFIPDNRAQLEAEYDKLMAQPGRADLLNAAGLTREELVDKRVLPDRFIYKATSFFSTPFGKRQYTLNGERAADKNTFKWCDFQASFSSVSKALKLIESEFNLLDQRFRRGNYIEWGMDLYPNWTFRVIADDLSSDRPGEIIIGVRRQ